MATAEYHREWYAKNKKKRHEQIYAYQKRVLSEVKDWIWEYLSTHPCVDCGEKDARVLEFDHVRGKKSFNISHKARQGGSTVKLIASEVKKCEVRCCNCHRRKTSDENSHWRSKR